MISYYIKDLDDAKRLANICSKYDFTIDVIYGMQTINGSSILGVASLVGNHISIDPHTNDRDQFYAFVNDLNAYSFENDLNIPDCDLTANTGD